MIGGTSVCNQERSHMQHPTGEVRRKRGSMRHNNIHKEEECEESNLERQENTAVEMFMVHGDSMLTAIKDANSHQGQQKSFLLNFKAKTRNKCFSSMMSNKENM